MAIHKRIQIASGSSVPSAAQHPIDIAQYDKAEHFNKMVKHSIQPIQTISRYSLKQLLFIILILLGASFLIYMLLKGSKFSNPFSSVTTKHSAKVFYF
jgi:hypothetical protein